MEIKNPEVVSHICGMLRIVSYKKGFGDDTTISTMTRKAIEFDVQDMLYLDKDCLGGTTDVNVIAEDMSGNLINNSDLLKFTIVITADIKGITKDQARKRYNDFIRLIQQKYHIVQKCSSIIDNDRSKKRGDVD